MKENKFEGSIPNPANEASRYSEASSGALDEGDSDIDDCAMANCESESKGRAMLLRPATVDNERTMVTASARYARANSYR